MNGCCLKNNTPVCQTRRGNEGGVMPCIPVPGNSLREITAFLFLCVRAHYYL
jgi:hypothetical protein